MQVRAVPRMSQSLSLAARRFSTVSVIVAERGERHTALGRFGAVDVQGEEMKGAQLREEVTKTFIESRGRWVFFFLSLKITNGLSARKVYSEEGADGAFALHFVVLRGSKQEMEPHSNNGFHELCV